MMHRSTTAHLVASWSRPLSPWIDAFSTMFELVDATTPTHVPPLPPMVLHMLARRTSERVVDVDNKHVATAKSPRKRQDAHDCLVTTNQGAAPSPLDTNFEMRVIRLTVLTERGAEWALKIPLPALREIVVANGNATSHAASLVSRFSSITRLQLCNTSCCALPAVPWATLASLTEISLHLVSLRTEDLQGIDALPALRRLDLRGCKCSSPVTQLSSNSLEEITFRDMWVGKFDGLEALPSLRKLTAIDLVGTVDVTALSHCQALQELYVGPAIRTNKCDRCTGCLDTSEMHALRKLTLYGVDTLPVLGAGCAPLEYLELTDVKSLSGVEAIDTLKTLIVRCSPSLLNVTSLARCKSLTSLTIDAPWLETAGTLGLEAIATLTQLSLAGCSKVDSVAHLGKSQSLKTLVVPANVRPSGLSGLELIPTLEVLSLAGCRYIANVEHLALAPALHTLNLNGTRIHVDGVAALAKLPTLRSLSMSHCARLKDLRWLNNSSIEVLTANGSGLSDPDEHIKGICLPKLQSISLHSSDDKFNAMCKKHRIHPAQPSSAQF